MTNFLPPIDLRLRKTPLNFGCDPDQDPVFGSNLCQNYGRILTKFLTMIDLRLRKTPLNFGGDLDQDPGSGSELRQNCWTAFDKTFITDRS